MIEQGDIITIVDGQMKLITPSKDIDNNPMFKKVECFLAHYKDGKLVSEEPFNFYVINDGY